MTAFQRAVSVQVGDERGEGLAFDERFRVSFELTKTLEPEGGDGVVRIYNPAPATRDRLVRDALFVVVAAGYQGAPVGEIYSGDVVRAVYKHERPDTYLEFELTDGARAINNTRISVAFAAGTPIRTVLDAVLNRLDLPVRETGYEVDGVYQQGVAFTGLARDALDRVIAKAGLTWSIQDGRIQILAPDAPANTSAVRLTPDTGLIASPEKLDDRESETQRQKGDGYLVRTLMSPKVEPGASVLLAAQGIDEAEYRVDRVVHLGDTRGNDWYTEAEVYATP